MRDPNRIKDILEAVEIYWKENPDLRLMQLLLNAAETSKIDPYYLEDEALLTLLRRIYDTR